MWIIQPKKSQAAIVFLKYLGKRGNAGFGRLIGFILGMTICITWCQGYTQMVIEKFVVPVTYKGSHLIN